MTLAGIVGGAVAGLICGAVILRAQGLPQLVLSIALVYLFHEFANKASDWTGGSDGLSGISADPLFGLFAEPSSTIILTTAEKHMGAIEKLAGEYNFFVARIGTTGGDRLAISVDHQPLISASLADLREPWATALEAALHDEVTA